MAAAQIDANSSESCLPDAQVSDTLLQGQWLASFEGSSETARIVLGPHPQWLGTVKGTIERSTATYPMVGDMNQGRLTLEESADGTRITGTWLGELVPGSCGREIRGSFLTAEDAAEQAFILRKQP